MINGNNTKKRYSEKLQDARWQQMKSSIQIRDEFTCQKCKRDRHTLPPGVMLHVHHRHYLTGRDPWDYPDNLLVLLCAECHHEEEECAEVLKELVPALHNFGYFNTEIRDEINKLIESRMNHAGQNSTSKNFNQ